MARYTRQCHPETQAIVFGFGKRVLWRGNLLHAHLVMRSCALQHSNRITAVELHLFSAGPRHAPQLHSKPAQQP